jgi:hypothetical protein
MRHKNHISIVDSLIDTCNLGFEQLNSNIQQEMLAFIHQSQHITGLFADRGNTPDGYYSLFGYFLLCATKQEKQLLQLSTGLHALQQQAKGIDAFCKYLIGIHASETEKKPGFYSVLMQFKKIKAEVSPEYSWFMLALLLDMLHGKHPVLIFLLKVSTFFFPKVKNVPCSILAAKTILWKYLKKRDNLAKRLFHFYDNKGGFRAFAENNVADMLSTAVALFAIKYSQEDIRAIKPDILNYIEKNYKQGAFLAGTGDMYRDVEYTFYGLLALGSLA